MSDELPVSVPVDPPRSPAVPSSPARPRRRRIWAVVAGVVGAVLVVAAIVGLVLHVDYVIIEPGDATAVGDVVSVHGAPSFHHGGELLFLTVSVSSRRPSLWQYVAASLDADAHVLSAHDYFQGVSPRQDRRLNVQAMDLSQQTAKKVALEKLGYRVPGTGAIVALVTDRSPAAGVLRIGDVITAIDGQPVASGAELGPAVRRGPPGAAVTLTVERRGATSAERIVTAAAPDGPNRGQAYLGIVPDTRYAFPVDVRIDPGQVSGPSAGLAFTLAILDDMTPANLTGGRRVAVTGEISSDGAVDDVGGVAQKAVAARDAGARLMLVPVREAREARTRAGSMRVVGVRTLDDALTALRRAGGAPLVASPRAA